MTTSEIIQNILNRYPQLACVQESLAAVCSEIITALSGSGTLFMAGNGGSACDCEHLAGELLKGFCSKRPLDGDLQARFVETFGQDGDFIAKSLQKGLRCIALTSHPGFLSAFANDVDASLTYAQQLQALGRENDIVIGFSTSGNADNICKLFMTARILGIKTVLFTGKNHGKAEQYADFVINVPETETYKIQELHLPVYHTLALIIENHFFGK